MSGLGDLENLAGDALDRLLAVGHASLNLRSPPLARATAD